MPTYLDQNQLYKKRRGFRIKIYFIVLAILLLSIGVFYIVAYSAVFRIREFKISGAEHLTQEEIIRILEPLALTSKLQTFLGSNNLISWTKKAPNVEKTPLMEARIRRDWLEKTIEIEVKERERLAIWCDQNDSCYWIDSEGTTFEAAPETEGSLILTIIDNRKKPVIKGTEVVEKRFAGNVIKILKGILELKIPVKKVVFDGQREEIQTFSYSGPDLFFSIRFDPTLNLASLQSLEEKIDFKGMKYVDLRVENRIYYKNL